MEDGMIGILLVVCSLTVHQLESMLVKHYGKKYGKGGMFFNSIICIFAMVYFFVTDKGGLSFPPPIWIYGLVNSTIYATGFYAGYMAYKTGSFGLTRLLTSFGVMVSTFYGIIFLKEPTNTFTYIALGMILVSLFLMNYQGRDGAQKEPISLKWTVFVALIIISNAAIAIIGSMQHGV